MFMVKVTSQGQIENEYFFTDHNYIGIDVHHKIDRVCDPSLYVQGQIHRKLEQISTIKWIGCVTHVCMSKVKVTGLG